MELAKTKTKTKKSHQEGRTKKSSPLPPISRSITVARRSAGGARDDAVSRVQAIIRRESER